MFCSAEVPSFNGLAMAQDYEERIRQAMRGDQFGLRRQAKCLRERGRPTSSSDKQLDAFEKRLCDSLARREARARSVPACRFENDLPITARREEIAAALLQNQVVVVAGETGSGKSTQLPKICLEAGFGVAAMIGHTQPRRIAARSVAARVAEELGSPLGQAVGYKVRFQDKTNPNTYIKLMTDGILLAETAGDRFLEQYEVIILDEAHERSLNVDFLIGMLRGLLQRRPDLRLIVTSATMDADRFGEHFGTARGPAPVIKVEGRTFPVEVRYRPVASEGGKTTDSYVEIVEAVHELSVGGGDTLIFLPTERDIREMAKRLRADRLLQNQGRPIEILPLYARLSPAEQNRIFHPGKARRIVLATNVAESSLTVPRIHSVVDTGTARISRYSARLRMQRLPIEAISQASAEQRKGRCGRLGPGVCIRLYEEEDFAGRPAYTTPEIRRTNLASVILQAKYLRLGEVDQIPFLDPPRPESVREGYKTLLEIGGVDEHRRLTDRGRTLAQFPVDPRIARMILAAHEEHCLADVLIIAAALEVQDPRLRPTERQQAADDQHARFVDEQSDFVSYLKLWDYVEERRKGLSRGKFQKLCEREFLSGVRLREWSEVHRQLRQTAIDQGLQSGRRSDDYASIHRALLTGLLSSIAYRTEEHAYTGAGGKKFFLWPGSGLFARKPNWIMAAELIETRKRYGRTVAKIDPNWLEPLAPHLVQRTCSDAHWHAQSLSVMAFERITLFGLPIVTRRRVRFGPIDPVAARQLFIHHGFVQQQMEVGDRFFRRNRKVREDAEELAAKTRRREFILDEYRVHAFYEDRIPEDVFDMASLRSAMRKDARLEDSLHMSLRDLLPEEQQAPDAQEFPSSIDVGSMKLPLSYHFEPGADRDGVTVTVPVEALSQVHREHVEWVVPGLVEEKLVALIRSLPKSIRRALVPAPDTARRVARELDFGKGLFLPEVARRFSEIAGEPISADHFRLERIPDHLRLRLAVVDEGGQLRAAGRDLQQIRSDLLSDEQQPSVSVDVPSSWNRDGLTTFDFEDLPREVRITRGSIEVVLFPAIVDHTDSAGLRLIEIEAEARRLTRGGLRRLYLLANRKPLRSQVRWLPRWEEIVLWMSSVLNKSDLEGQLQLLLSDRAFLGEQELPRSKTEFAARQDESGQRIAEATQDLAELLPGLAETYHQCRLASERIAGPRWRASREDIELQLAELLHAEFLTETPWRWLRYVPRFLQAISYRIEKLSSGGQSRDEANMEEVQPYRRRLAEIDASVLSERSRAARDEYAWMIQEYRVSLFAQRFGTSIKVSPQRLEQQWQKVLQPT